MAEAQETEFEAPEDSVDFKGYKATIDEEIAAQRAQNERARAAAEAARQQREPEFQELKRRQAEFDKIPPPRFERPPAAPNTQEMLKPTSLQKTFGMASVFALLSVGLTKGSAIYGLRALGGFMKGAHEGNMEQAKAAHQDFLDKMQEVHDINENALKDYNAIIGNKKFTLQQQEQMYRQKALEYQDELGLQAQTQGGMNAVTALNRQKAEVDFKMLAELDRRRRVIEMERHNKAMEARPVGGAARAGGMDSVLGIPIADIPPLPAGQEKNEAFLSMLPPAQASMVKDMDAGKLPVSGFGGFAVKDRSELLKATSIYHPGSSASQKYIVATKALQETTPGGPIGRNELAINTLAEHIDQWSTAMNKLNNSQLRRWNEAKNKLSMEFGDPALQEAQVPAGIAASEIARIVKGGTAAPTIPEEEYWKNVFNTSSSPEQTKKVIWAALEASGGRLISIERAFRQMGLERHVLTPEARDLLLKHKPKNAPMPEWLKSGAAEPKRGTKVTLEQAKEMIRKYGSVDAAVKAAKEQGLQFE